MSTALTLLTADLRDLSAAVWGVGYVYKTPWYHLVFKISPARYADEVAELLVRWYC